MADPDGLDSSLMDEFKPYYTSLCTIQDVVDTNVTDSTGGVSRGTPTNVSGLVNIPCRKMPAFKEGTRSGSVQVQSAMTEDRELYQVNLMGYYPQITPAMIAVIDTEPYPHYIVGAQADGNKIYTVLRTETKRI